MPGTIPVHRPIFLDEELRNGAFATPTLMRKLIDWCRFTWARDGWYAPSAPAPDRHWDDRPTTDFDPTSGFPFSINSRVTDAFETGGHWIPFGSFYAPDPLTPSRKLVVQVYMEGARLSPTEPAQVLFTSNRGASHLVEVAAEGWVESSFPLAPDSIVTVQARHACTSGATATKLLSLSAWWDSSSAVIAGMSTSTTGIPLPSEDFPVQNRALSVALLRSLGRWANRVTARTTRMVAAKSYYRSAKALTDASAEPGYILRRYKVRVGEFTDMIYVRWVWAGSATSAEFRVELGGSVVHTSTSISPDQTATISITPQAEHTAELVVRVLIAGTGTCYLTSLDVWEGLMAASARVLPSGESYPPTFPTLNRDAIRAESTIKATGETGLRDILQAQRFLVQGRRRYLVSDAHGRLDRDTGASPNAAEATGVQARNFIGTAGGLKVRVRAAMRGVAPGTNFPVEGAIVGRYEDEPSPAYDVTASEVRTFQAHPLVANRYEEGTQQIDQYVTAWPEWVTVDVPAFDSFAPLKSIAFTSGNRSGLYDLEWCGACFEGFIPEDQVP